MTATTTLRAAIETYASAASVSRSSRSTRAAPSRLAAAMASGDRRSVRFAPDHLEGGQYKSSLIYIIPKNIFQRAGRG